MHWPATRQSGSVATRPGSCNRLCCGSSFSRLPRSIWTVNACPLRMSRHSGLSGRRGYIIRKGNLMTGTFELAEQRGNKGYYGKVLIEVEPDPTLKGCEISFDEPNAGNAEWRDAAKFGIEYAYAHIPKKE